MDGGCEGEGEAWREGEGEVEGMCVGRSEEVCVLAASSSTFSKTAASIILRSSRWS